MIYDYLWGENLLAKVKWIWNQANIFGFDNVKRISLVSTKALKYSFYFNWNLLWDTSPDKSHENLSADAFRLIYRARLQKDQISNQ